MPSFEVEFLQSIFIAIVNNSKGTKTQLSERVESELSYLSYLQEYNNEFFHTIQEQYEECKNLLKFKNQIMVYRP